MLNSYPDQLFFSAASLAFFCLWPAFLWLFHS